MIRIARLDIKALTWKRTRGAGNARYMPKEERAYYVEVEAALRRHNFDCFPGPPVELIARLEFHFLSKHWRDIDNLEKAIFDAGQPSKWWLPASERRFITDLWDDKQFRRVEKERFRGSDGDYILIEIESV